MAAMEMKSGPVLVRAMSDLDELAVLQCAMDMTTEGASSRDIFENLLEGLREVYARVEAGDYFIADLMMAGHIMRSVMNKVLAWGGLEEFGSFGKVVIATVRNDIHELGKNVVTDVLRHNGFEVTDLGADVPEERLVEAVRTLSPDILILSGMLSASPDRMAEAIAALRREGLRDGVRIAVGGAPLTLKRAAEIGADAYCGSVLDCLRLCHEFMAAAAGAC